MSIADATDHSFTGQRTVTAMQSTGRVAVHVQTTDARFREAIENGVLYLVRKARQESGVEIDIGITHGTPENGVPAHEYRVSVFADGEPTDFGFLIRYFDPNVDGNMVGRMVIQNALAAYKAHIVPLKQNAAVTN